MKKNAVFYIVFMATLLIISSCHHSSSNNHTTYGGTLSCNVNGIPFNATKCEAYSYLGKYPGMTIVGAISNLSTSSVDNPIMNIRIFDYYYIGPYVIGPYMVGSIINLSSTTIYIDSSTSVTGCENGTLTIDSMTPNIVGTFSFTASDSTKVTNGRFSVPAPK